MEVSAEELRKYGYVAGEYQYICRSCFSMTTGHKHGFTCRDCALDTRQKMLHSEREKNQETKSTLDMIKIVDIIERDDGGADVVVDISPETIMLFAKQGLIDALFEAAKRITKEQGGV